MVDVPYVRVVLPLTRGLSFVRSSDTLRTSTAHCPNALWIERLTALVEVSGLFELGADLAQTEALASLRVSQIGGLLPQQAVEGIVPR
jgi:hypothetical protein